MATHDARSWTPLAAAIALASGTCNAIPPNITVTDAGDGDVNGATTCTLRQAIAIMNGQSITSACPGSFANNEIVFDGALANSTITLTQGQLAATAPFTITGSGQTIDANGASRVLYVAGTTLTASHLTLSGGVAPSSKNAGGGILAYQTATVHLNNCRVTGNSAVYGGGIAAVLGSTVTMSNSAVSANIAGEGGGVASYASSVTLVHSTLANNTAAKSAGVWAAKNSTLVFLDSTVSGNTASDSFGGVYVAYSSSMTMTNTTVYNNAAHYFAGVFSGDSAVKLVNSTVAKNQATHYGGVSGQFANTAADSITLYNSIVAKNDGGDCYYDANTTITAAYTLIGDSGSSCGIADGDNGNIVGKDPLLSPLADNGGVTMTMALDTVTPSPAVGAGSLGLALLEGAPLLYDQRGTVYPRTIDGTVDLGAWQSQDSRVFANGFEADDSSRLP